MKNLIRKIGLFILSLWLLFLLIIVITADVPVCFGINCEFIGFEALISRNVVPVLCLIFLIVGGFSYYDFTHQTKGTAQLSFEIIEIENIDYEHLTFLTTYIIPLVCFQFDSLRYQIVFVVILLVIGMIYIRTDLFYANPTLAILNFRIYRVSGEFRGGETRTGKILISKDDLSNSDEVRYIKLDERIYYAYRVE